MRIEPDLTPAHLEGPARQVVEAAGPKVLSLLDQVRPDGPAPVMTVRGRYTARAWTEWTRGFPLGMALLLFDATGDMALYRRARDAIVEQMGPFLTHTGVHDHGFNIGSTFGNLWRLAWEGRTPVEPWERRYYELALKTSGAVQASRWARTADGGGYIPSFNGPHSLFVDTIRTLRVLAIAHLLGHSLLGEGDRPISLLGRLVQHARATATYNVYYGEGRDAYDVPGRVAHEAIFHPQTGEFRCPGTQQGYSPFTTWTRGLAWAILGFAELLEFAASLPEAELEPWGGKAGVCGFMERAARVCADYYVANTASDGIPYWDTGAPGLAQLGDWRSRPAEPDNPYEPVDSSAAAIAAQGLVRLGRYLAARGDGAAGARFLAAGLTVARTLFSPPYLDPDPRRQGLIVHALYHRPRGWDAVPEGGGVPRGEATIWGDYHALELAVLLLRMAGGRYMTFFPPA